MELHILYVRYCSFGKEEEIWTYRTWYLKLWNFFQYRYLYGMRSIRWCLRRWGGVGEVRGANLHDCQNSRHLHPFVCFTRPKKEGSTIFLLLSHFHSKYFSFLTVQQALSPLFCRLGPSPSPPPCTHPPIHPTPPPGICSIERSRRSPVLNIHGNVY